MSRSLLASEAIVDYVQTFGAREHPAQVRCREETNAMGEIARMQISPEQGAFMQVMARAVGAKRAIEVGVFTGYSSLAVALTMRAMHGPDCRLVACDISEDYTAKARGYWAEAGVEDVVDLRIAPAVETLDALVREGGAGSYDLAFIDADKTGYAAYYERCLTLLRPGGLMLIDNMLWSGRVADPAENEPDTLALRELAAAIHADARVEMTLATVGDGLTLAVKR